MSFDSLCLAAVAAELRRSVAGRSLGAVVVSSPDELAVAVPSGAWLVSIAAREARTHLIPGLPEPSARPPGVQTHLDSLLRGAAVTRVAVVDLDRVLHVDLDTCDRVGRPRALRVIVEIMGKHSACVVVDAEGTIQATLKPVTRAVNRHRELLPKLPYLPPPGGGRSDPRGLTAEAFAAAWPALAAAGCWRDGWRRLWHGLSDPLWAWLCRRAELPVDGAGEQPGAGERLWSAWREMAGILAADVWQPCLVRDSGGLPVDAWPLPLPGSEPAASLSAALHLVASHAADRTAIHALRAELSGAVGQALRRARGRLADLHKRRERAAEADRWQAEADLILSNLHRIALHDTELTVPDWPEPGSAVTIALDPAVPGPRQAERLYDRARRARQAAGQTDEDQARLEAELAELEQLAQRVTAAADQGALSGLRDAVRAVTGTGPAPAAARPRNEREALLQKLPHHTVAGGWVVLVGRNAAESEALLSRIAAPTDFWFHVRGAGSGHIILRTEGRPEAVAPAALEEAARIAAWHSRMKHSALVPVACTQRKYVTKVRGGAAGKVVYRNERTLFAEPARP